MGLEDDDMKQIKKRGSFASYRDKKNHTLFRVNINEMAKNLLEWGNTPQTLNNTRAFELRLLAEAYLDAVEEIKELKNGVPK